MRKRDRIIAAKRRILRELVEHLERDRSMEDADGILGIDALLVEFRRRAELEAPAVPPGHEHLPGLGLFQIVFPSPDRCLFDEGHELPHRGVRVDQPGREDDTYDWDGIDEAAAAQS